MLTFKSWDSYCFENRVRKDQARGSLPPFALRCVPKQVAKSYIFPTTRKPQGAFAPSLRSPVQSLPGSGYLGQKPWWDFFCAWRAEEGYLFRRNNPYRDLGCRLGRGRGLPSLMRKFATKKSVDCSLFNCILVVQFWGLCIEVTLNGSCRMGPTPGSPSRHFGLKNSLLALPHP